MTTKYSNSLKKDLPDSEEVEHCKQSESIDERSAESEAVKFLQELLKDRPVRSQAVFEAGRRAGISDKTLQRAKKKIGVISKKDPGYAGGWSWKLLAVEGSKMDNQDGQSKRNVHLTLSEENESVYMHNLPKDGQVSTSVHHTSPPASWLWERCPNCGKDKYITKPCICADDFEEMEFPLIG